MSYTQNKRFLLNLKAYIDSQLVRAFLAGTVAIGGLSLLLIALRLGPISRQATIWNSCVSTTMDFLSVLPAFARAESSDLQAMSVNLCNGSMPQQQKEPVEIK